MSPESISKFRIGLEKPKLAQIFVAEACSFISRDFCDIVIHRQATVSGKPGT
jgi:hypothetical protein